MSIAVTCPACQSRISLADALAGRKAKCPRCQATIYVPQTAAAADSPWEMATEDAVAPEQPVKRRAVRPAGSDSPLPSPLRQSSLSPRQIGARVGGALLLVAMLMAVFLKFAGMAKRAEQNRPAQPIEYLPTIDGLWTDARGSLTFAPDDQQVDGHHALHRFEKSDGGAPITGLAVAWNSFPTSLPWQKGEYLMYVMENAAVKRREKMIWQFDATTLKTWDEKGRERVYKRKA